MTLSPLSRFCQGMLAQQQEKKPKYVDMGTMASYQTVYPLTKHSIFGGTGFTQLNNL